MSKQRILILATTASMIEQFNIHNIKILQSLGAEVHVGTNFKNPGTITKDISKQLISKLISMNVKYHQIDFMRGIGTHRANKKALLQVCHVIKKNKITGIHAHSPLGGIIGRRAAHKMHVKIIYTAHGLQFFKGGPLKDWALFFPIEWFYAHWTDALVTINRDDYSISRFLPVKHRYYIPGVGIDLERITNIPSSERETLRKSVRKKLNVKDDDFLIISVGELSKRKNHATVIKVINRLHDSHIKYCIAGIGPEKENLVKLIHKYHLENEVTLLGYVSNLDGLYYAADLNVFISKREGLGIGGLDGVAHNLYIIGNRRTGMKDYIKEPEIGLLLENPEDESELARKIVVVKTQRRKVQSKDIIARFDHKNVDQIMRKIYSQQFMEE